MDAVEWSQEAAWPCEGENISKARRFVVNRLQAYGLQALEDDVSLVVSELTTNAVVHAGTPFVVVLARTNGTLELTVADSEPLQPEATAHPSIRALPSIWALSGRGLPLVDACTRDWGIRPVEGGKEVWASFSV